MSTTPTSEAIESTQETKRGRRWLWLVVAFIGGLLIGAVVVWQLVDDGGSSDVVEVSAEVEQEIAELADSFHQHLHRQPDGDAMLALFAADGRMVNEFTGLEGASGEELKTGIDGSSASTPTVEIADPLIVPRPTHYDVAYYLKKNPLDGTGYMGLLHVVDEDGSMKIRYAQYPWTSLGWFQVTEDFPYQVVATG